MKEGILKAIEDMQNGVSFGVKVSLNTTKIGQFVILQALQEQLDRVEGCGWCHHCSSCIYSLDDKDDAPCSCCEVKGIELTNFYARPYCPNCGRKLKNESEKKNDKL